ncbi:hypothetical protein [Dyadobacter fanqingshengii]|uniref:Uncharacterized protein n=1 Tax=Dyadobacter fanqingshengii TaxID=2906443 RepID=A0A9X1P7A6_9BACT|nr:hypothetical protein [Dyadobacter fanqingshengii]MCF0038498.1 hypothetical protein [Dyadobacter fanqingshengii]USJ34668.1 hypothetical protein NFI81_18375 [Dyadobacter fanqingshengii]
MRILLFFLMTITLILYLATKPWQTDGTCDQVAQVHFRGINFQFPLKIKSVLNPQIHGFIRNSSWLQTDYFGSNQISTKWFFNWDNDWNGQQEISDALKEKRIFGIAFELHKDSCKTDQEIISEIQKIYPGNYRHFENHGNTSYIWERDCLTIFVKRANQYPAKYSVPEVSFCYGLDDEQINIYATYTGYINHYPD